MKRKIIGFISLCLCLIACQQTPDISIDDGICNSPPPTYTNGLVWVVKFKQPEYKENILVASPVKGQSHIMIQNPYKTGVVFGFTVPRVVQDLYGKAPYTELLNDYLLIDWKYYRVMTSVLRSEPSLLTNKWEELDNLHTEWPVANICVKQPCAEIIKIPIDSLNAYVGGTLRYPSVKKFDIIYMEVNDGQTYREQDLQEYQQYLSIGDSAYAEYEAVLNQMLIDGEELSNHGNPDFQEWY